MMIRDWPTAEQPEKRLLTRGARALSNSEILALVIGRGARGLNAVDHARTLLVKLGGLCGVLAADATTRHKIGISDVTYARVTAAAELAWRCFHEQLEHGEHLTNPNTTRDFLSARLRDLTHEVFACLYLDTRHRVIGFEELFRGSIDGASVHPREVVKQALAHNAAAIIFAHNHPSGIAEPSDADRQLTKRLRDALALVDIRVLDHFVIGNGETVSFAERGLL